MSKNRPSHGNKTIESRGAALIDSGAWIALFSSRDQHHIEAERLFREAIKGRALMLTTNLVVAEVHRLLLFRAGQRAAATALERIEASPSVQIEFATAAHHRAARSWMDKLAPHSVTYTDAVSFAMMESFGCAEVLSFDNAFVIAGFTKRKSSPL